MRHFFDTEFLEDGRTIELISIGIVAEDGREYYAVSDETTRRRLRRRIRKHDWLMANVVPSLPRAFGDARMHQPKRWLFNYADPCVKPRAQIACEVRDFILGPNLSGKVPPVELWADYAAYDHVALCQLWGRMIDLPEGIPMWTHDLQQEIERRGVSPELAPRLSGVTAGMTEHNALHDAREVAYRYQWLSNLNTPPACRTCDGSGTLTVPDPGMESASEQACPDPVHRREPDESPDADDHGNAPF